MTEKEKNKEIEGVCKRRIRVNLNWAKREEKRNEEGGVKVLTRVKVAKKTEKGNKSAVD
jgi:hypothetical protein